MKTEKNNRLINWLVKFLKGMLMGSGAILPGVSGGALAAVFGLYRPLIRFLANLRVDFMKNVLFFLPVGLGGLFGVFVLATPIDYGLRFYPVFVLWGFIGAILGTLRHYTRRPEKPAEKRNILSSQSLQQY